MKKPNEDKLTEYILAGLGVIPVVWAALMVAPFLSEGLAGIVEGFTSGMRNPMKVTWCADSLNILYLYSFRHCSLQRHVRLVSPNVGRKYACACDLLSVQVFRARAGEVHSSSSYFSSVKTLKNGRIPMRPFSAYVMQDCAKYPFQLYRHY